MKKLGILTTLLFTFGLFMVPAVFATGSSADNKDKQNKQYGQGDYQKDQKGQSQAQQGKQFHQQKQNLVLIDKLSGAEVQNQQGENIGEIDRVLVDVKTGRVGFVTLTSGGLLGVGEDKYIVPFNALQENKSQGTEAQLGDRELSFTLNKQKDQLKEVPQGDIEEALTQEDQSRGIFEHYGVSPYWEDDQRQQNRQDDTHRNMMDDSKKDKMMDKKDHKKNQ